jgi:hypothetical protein
MNRAFTRHQTLPNVAAPLIVVLAAPPENTTDRATMGSQRSPEIQAPLLETAAVSFPRLKAGAPAQTDSCHES